MDKIVELLREASRVNPEELNPDEMVFVFGSNEQGRHGGGAARYARDKYGAIMNQGFGRMNGCFGIPTCKWTTNKPGFEIPLDKLAQYINLFIEYARENTGERFKVTRVGCGLAGFTDEQVAPLWKDAPSNCYFDTAWKPFLGEDRNYWGHVG